MEIGIKEEQLTPNQYLVVTPKDKKIGLWLLIAANIALLFPLLAKFTMTYISFVNDNSHSYESDLVYTNILLISRLLMIVLFAGAAIFLSHKKLAVGLKFDERSGRGEKSEIPDEIRSKKICWGAILLSMSWGIYYKVWIAFLVVLAFLPYGFLFDSYKTLELIVNIFVLFLILFLSRNGYKLAWQKQKWESVEKFLEEQKKWSVWGKRFILLCIFIPVFYLAIAFLTVYI